MSALETLKETIGKMADTIRTLLDEEDTKYRFVDFPAVMTEKLVSREKAIKAINSTKQVSNGTKFTQAGMVSVYVKCSVSNHDNSNEDYIGCYITKNGVQVAHQRIWVGEFSGGSVSCSKAFTVQAGDTVAFTYYGNDDKCINVSGSGSIVYTPNPF